jgi:hypothetical protein
VRVVAFALASVLALLCSGCAIWEKETRNRGGYLDYILDEHWLKADSKRMRALRAFAIEVSLARIASVSSKNQSDRNALAARIGTLTEQFMPVYRCAMIENPLDVPSAKKDPCFYYDSAMVEYSSGLFDLAMVALPVEDAKNLINSVTTGSVNPVSIANVVNALVVIGRDALTYGRVVGALYRDTIELEVQVWLATPDYDPRPPPARVTEADVAMLRAIYAQGNDNMPAWINMLAALHNAGLEPYPNPKFFFELNALLNYMCGLITSDKKIQCTSTLPSPAAVVASPAISPPVGHTPVVVPPPTPKPQPVPFNPFKTVDPEHDILRAYLRVGSSSFDPVRAQNLQNLLAQADIQAQIARDQGGGPKPRLPDIVDQVVFAPTRKLLVKAACQQNLFQQVPGDTILASACKS